MNLQPLFNREGALPADGFIHVVPRGEFANTEAGVTQVYDDASLDSILRNFQAAKANPNFRGIHIGPEHWLYEPDQSSAAYGWGTDLVKRADGLWLKAELNSLGEAAIKDRQYAGVSPVHPAPADGGYEKLGGKRVRPLSIDSVGLTNYGQFRGQMRPLFNRAGAGASADKPQSKNNNMKSIATLLGLQPDASEESIHAAVTSLRNRAESAASELPPLKNRVTELEAQLTTQNKAMVEADLAPLTTGKLKNRAKPEQVESFRQLLLLNREKSLPALQGYIASLEAAPAATQGGQVLLNRQGQNPPAAQGGEGGAAATDDGQALAQKAEAAVNEHMLKNRCTYTQARNAVRMTNPALFGITVAGN